MDIFNLLQKSASFDWDSHNVEKNRQKHQVTLTECEQIFFNRPLMVVDDPKHSEKETRLYALGHTDENRMLFIAFTLRTHKIRVISARDMSRKERKAYQAHEQENPEIQN
jgi:uncharacterized DUF497 family protein